MRFQRRLLIGVVMTDQPSEYFLLVHHTDDDDERVDIENILRTLTTLFTLRYRHRRRDGCPQTVLHMSQFVYYSTPVAVPLNSQHVSGLSRSQPRRRLQAFSLSIRGPSTRNVGIVYIGRAAHLSVATLTQCNMGSTKVVVCHYDDRGLIKVFRVSL